MSYHAHSKDWSDSADAQDDLSFLFVFFWGGGKHISWLVLSFAFEKYTHVVINYLECCMTHCMIHQQNEVRPAARPSLNTNPVRSDSSPCAHLVAMICEYGLEFVPRHVLHIY